MGSIDFWMGSIDFWMGSIDFWMGSIDFWMGSIDFWMGSIDFWMGSIDFCAGVLDAAQKSQIKRDTRCVSFLYKLNNSRTSSSLKLESIVSPGSMTWSMSSLFFCCKSYIFSSIVPSVIKRMT